MPRGRADLLADRAENGGGDVEPGERRAFHEPLPVVERVGVLAGKVQIADRLALEAGDRRELTRACSRCSCRASAGSTASARGARRALPSGRAATRPQRRRDTRDRGRARKRFRLGLHRDEVNATPAIAARIVGQHAAGRRRARAIRSPTSSDDSRDPNTAVPLLPTRSTDGRRIRPASWRWCRIPAC